MAAAKAPLTVWTIGHSIRALDEFLELLREHRIRTLADVRTLPRSRRHPHFSADALAPALEREGIGYVHIPEVGGLRKPRENSRNTAWKNDAFRGYADYMETAKFEGGLQRVTDLAAEDRTAIMCAEADWRQCHRGLLADALKLRGVRVIHVGGKDGPHEHPYTRQATVEGGRLSYSGRGLFEANR